MVIIYLNEYQIWGGSTRYSYSLIVIIFYEYIMNTSSYFLNIFWILFYILVIKLNSRNVMLQTFIICFLLRHVCV